MTLAQTVREAYRYMDETLTWEIWHEMSHEDRVEVAALLVDQSQAGELK